MYIAEKGPKFKYKVQPLPHNLADEFTVQVTLKIHSQKYYVNKPIMTGATVNLYFYKSTPISPLQLHA
jgi:hypothetical protein